MTDFIFLACDPLYFTQHGYAGVRSALDTGNNVYLSIIDNLEYNINDAEGVSTKVENLIKNIQIPGGQTFIVHRDFRFGLRSREFFASYRFIVAHEILKEQGNNCRLLIYDADSIFRKKVPFPDTDLGLWFREDEDLGSNEYEKRGMKVAAGCVFVSSSPAGYRFSQVISQELLHQFRQKPRWFIDQTVLYESYHYIRALSEYDLKVIDLKPDYMTWKFEDDAMVFTGKGDRKFTDQRYVQLEKHYNESAHTIS